VDLGHGSGPSAKTRLGVDKAIVRVARIAKAWISFFTVSLLSVEAIRRDDRQRDGFNCVRCLEMKGRSFRPTSEEFCIVILAECANFSYNTDVTTRFLLGRLRYPVGSKASAMPGAGESEARVLPSVRLRSTNPPVLSSWFACHFSHKKLLAP